MENKVSAFLIIAILASLTVVYSLYNFPDQKNTQDFSPGALSKSQEVDIQERISPEEIMEIIKTDKDYNELSGFIGDFEPEIVSYIKLGLSEYQNIKKEWQAQQLEDRIALVDKINLTDSTYWIELKNKNDETKGLRMILGTKEKKSLLLIAALSIKAGIGI